MVAQIVLDPPFDEREEAFVLACRGEAERAFAPFEVVPDWTCPADDIVDVLAEALPIPAVLIGLDGRVLWMNREAELRVSAVGFEVGSAPSCASTQGALAELVSLGLRELARPGEWITNGRAPAWLRPAETLVVRRVTPRGGAACALVSFYVPAPSRSGELEAATVRARHGLSAREAEVAVLAADGYTVLAIAHRLGIAESTVSCHLKRLYRKLQVGSRVELAARLARPRSR